MSIKNILHKILFVLCVALVFTNELNAKHLHFALVTDTHIDVNDTSTTHGLTNIITEINQQKNIEFVILDGDISNSADMPSLLKAREILSNLNKPYYIVPGNHDVNWKEAELSNFVKVFGDDKFTFTKNGYQLIGLASRPDSIHSQAFIYPNEFEWLQKTIQPQMPVIVFTHYPLIAGDIKNYQQLINLLRQYNTILVVNGHYHKNGFFDYNGIPGVICRTALLSQNKPGGYSIFDIGTEISVSEKITGEEATEWLNFPVNN